MQRNEDGYDVLHPCDCQHLLGRLERLNAARIPVAYTHCTVESYQTPKTVKEAGDNNQSAVQVRVFKHISAYQPGARGLLLTRSANGD